MGNALSFYTPQDEVADGVEALKAPVLNSYATFSVVFYALYKAAIDQDPVFAENKHGIVAYRLRDGAKFPTEDRLSEALEPVSIGAFIGLIREKMGDELTPKDFKKLDLGGRDATTITKVMSGILPAEKMPKFQGGPALMTGGTLINRAKCLYTIRNGPVTTTKSIDLSGPAKMLGLSGTNNWFLLNPDTETLFTGLSILAFTQTNIENYWNTLIIPVGSKDAHFIYIDARGRVKFMNLLNYSGDDGAKFEALLRELVGSGNIDRIVFAGSFLFGLETRKFMADRDTPEVGVDHDDLDLEKHCFKSVSESTGEVLLGKILASRGARADEPDNYDFSFVTRSSGKGPELAKFLGNVFNNEFMRYQLETNVKDLLSFARNSLADLCPKDIDTMLAGFSTEVKSTRRHRAVML